MKLLKPFRGLRPKHDLAERVAAPPYDVINREEARKLAEGNPLSFLHVNKPEIDLPDEIGVHDPKVYSQGAENLTRMISDGVLVQDTEEKFYVYKQIMGQHEQVGLVAVASIDAYENNLIKKHEFTRPDKEDDRVAHMDALGAQVGPVFLTYKSRNEIDRLVNLAIQSEPEYDFVAVDGVRHVFWVVNDIKLSADLESAFDEVDCLYVADGHHRSAAASRVRSLYQKRNKEHQGDESYNWFLVVVFPDEQMQILDYNRIIRGVDGIDEDKLIQQLSDDFTVSKVESTESAKPQRENEFAVYINGHWYTLVSKVSSEEIADPVDRLDVSILQNSFLTPILGIEDQRSDARIDFVGGIRGLEELERRVDSGDWDLAVAIYPTSISNLMMVADADEVMPPKSTWFEPKLKSGLVIHMLD